MSKRGLIYIPNYVKPQQKKEFFLYFKTLFPIWENRFSKNNPPPEGVNQRRLLRPVYWLGNWQFACLNYYHPPKGIFNRCIHSEPYPDFLRKIVENIEALVHKELDERDIPRGWHLNTCLINYYGSQPLGPGSEKTEDRARVGEHKDFEPGPVASISFGERALFQFVRSEGKHHKSDVVLQQWLEDCSLQVFGGDKFKKHLFHRVQRVEDKRNEVFDVNTNDFQTRRINLTFRFVPPEHIVDFHKLPAPQKEDALEYVQALAQKSNFFQHALSEAN